MRALVTRLRPDRTREKVLVDDWAEPDAPVGNQVVTQTIYSGVTNGTERNDLLDGNYAHPDEALPAGWGYQNVGRVVELGPDVARLEVGDVLYASADHMEYVVPVAEAARVYELLRDAPHELMGTVFEWQVQGSHAACVRYDIMATNEHVGM